MKIFFLFIVSLYIKSAPAQLITNVVWTDEISFPVTEVISYSPGRDLVWKDFKGTPVESRAAAVTVSGFGYKASTKTINGKGNLNISIYCYFNKNKSWVKPGSNSMYILTHEQHHFDISYIAAKIFADKLKGTVFTNSNFNLLIPKIYNECCDLMNKMQDEYDGQTKNGQLKDIQAKWNNLLDEKLSLITK